MKNNEKTLERCLKSIASISDEILIGDNGLDEKFFHLIKNYNAKTVKISGNNSDCKNKLINSAKNQWILFIEPWEIIVSGIDQIIKIKQENKPASYYFQVLQSNIITKEIRLWHKNTNQYFINPIFESVINDKANYLEVILFSEGDQIRCGNEDIEKWKLQRMTSSEPYYYEAFLSLSNKDYDNFLKSAEYYLFCEKNGMSAVMMKYYLAMVKLYIYNDFKESIRHILQCIAVNPLMAEFWSLLGDAYYKLKEYDKAIAFYENGIILGGRRLKSDRWPLDIYKYENYPNKMIDSCKKMLTESHIFKSI